MYVSDMFWPDRVNKRSSEKSLRIFLLRAMYENEYGFFSLYCVDVWVCFVHIRSYCLGLFCICALEAWIRIEQGRMRKRDREREWELKRAKYLVYNGIYRFRVNSIENPNKNGIVLSSPTTYERVYYTTNPMPDAHNMRLRHFCMRMCVWERDSMNENDKARNACYTYTESHRHNTAKYCMLMINIDSFHRFRIWMHLGDGKKIPDPTITMNKRRKERTNDVTNTTCTNICLASFIQSTQHFSIQISTMITQHTIKNTTKWKMCRFFGATYAP